MDTINSLRNYIKEQLLVENAIALEEKNSKSNRNKCIHQGVIIGYENIIDWLDEYESEYDY